MNNKRFLHLVSHCGTQLTCRDIVVYSALIYRSRSDRTASKAWLSKITSIALRRAIPATLRNLQLWGLVRKDGKRWIACEPAKEWRLVSSVDKTYGSGLSVAEILAADPGAQIISTLDITSWFRWKPNCNRAWRDRFLTTKVYCRAVKSPLTLERNILYWTMVALNKGRTKQQNISGLKKLTGFSRPMIRAALIDFEKLGLIKRSGRSIKTLSPTAAHESYWQDKKQHKEPKPVADDRGDRDYNKSKSHVMAVNMMLAAKIPDDIITEQLFSINLLPDDNLLWFWDWHECFEQAKEGFERSGKDRFPHCGFLLTDLVKKRIKVERAANLPTV